jgi:hypothetical protein
LDIDKKEKEECERRYLAGPLIQAERRILHELLDVYKKAEKFAAERFLAAEVRFSAPVVRRAMLEKSMSQIVADVGGRTIPKHSSTRERPGVYTSHYSLFRVGDYGMTISAVGDEKRLPRQTDYRSSLIAGLEVPLEGLGIPNDFIIEDEPKERFDYLLFQHGKAVPDSDCPYYAKFCAMDTQYSVVWRRNLFANHIDFVREILDVRAEIEPEDAGTVQLKDHLTRLERGTEAE